MIFASIIMLALLCPRLVWAAPREIAFAQSATTVDAYDFVEITLIVDTPDPHNPFVDTTVKGHFEKASSTDRVSVDGFCDSTDGGTYPGYLTN
jgi:ABC-type sugar transport system substrate-binding protein